MKLTARNLVWLAPLVLGLIAGAGIWVLRAHHSAGTGGGRHATSPVAVVYRFVKETGGTTPVKGGKVLLGFNPNGQAFLYAFKPDGEIAYHGTWSHSNGKMTLKFTSSEFSVDAAFPLDLDDGDVTMPFQVFAGKPGESHWTRLDQTMAGGIYAVYLAAISDHDTKAEREDAMAQARAYAQAWISRTRSTVNRGARVTPAPSGDLIPTARAAGAGGSYPDCTDEPPESFEEGAPGVFVLVYPCGLRVVVYLEAASWRDTIFAAIKAGPLSGDPRVHLDPKPPGDASRDPPTKTALIIAPFTSTEAGAAPDSYVPISAWGDFMGGSATAAPDPGRFSIVPALARSGYAPTTLFREQASVEGITKALLQQPSPGVLIFNTHGSGVGSLATSDHWSSSDQRQQDGPYVEYVALLKQLREAGLGDLLDYGIKPGDYPATVIFDMVPKNMQDPSDLQTNVVLTPKYWEWLQKAHGANFQRSLVVVAACSTDETDTLRNTINAGAYFAWNADMSPKTVVAAMKYAVAHLTRPTHSAEEAFYNLQRINRTREMIYVEDKLLDGNVNFVERYDLSHLNAYGYDGNRMTPYRDAGWLGSGLNAGQVWWILFAARWSPDRDEGWTKIHNCWDEIWTHPELGALVSPQCNTYKGGDAPSEDNVGYAEYLLKGEAYPGFGGVKVPRWTLNDGGTSGP